MEYTKARHRLPEDHQPLRQRGPEEPWEVIIIGGGFAGLSASIYLGRALRETLVIDSGRSLGKWEPDVQNFLGFPQGISGEELLKRGRQQAESFGVNFCDDEILESARTEQGFVLNGTRKNYQCKRLLLATGLYHIPPDVPCVNDCIGHSMFFCKDCDGFRVQRQRIAINGRNNEAVRYALGMLLYSSCVIIITNSKEPAWDAEHARYIREYQIPVYTQKITHVEHQESQVRSLLFENGDRVAVDAIFATRGDVYYNTLAQSLGANLDEEGQVITNEDQATNVPGLYAAGCVSPANCQMIIAAGQGATGAQAINRDLFEESLRNHSLCRYRGEQIHKAQTIPELIATKP